MYRTFVSGDIPFKKRQQPETNQKDNRDRDQRSWLSENGKELSHLKNPDFLPKLSMILSVEFLENVGAVDLNKLLRLSNNFKNGSSVYFET